MESKIIEKMGFRIQPVGIDFSDEKPAEALEFRSDKKVCVISMLLAASKGKVVAISDETCACAGGAVGLCRGDAFTRRNHRTTELLSTGMKCESPEDLPEHLQYGERFFESPTLVQRWKDSLPYTEEPSNYIILKSLAEYDAENPPSIVFFFANPDQLSALVIMSGYSRGAALNVVAPFVAGCQSILLAYNEIGKDEPKAIMGGFDIAQRHRLPKEILTLTMPYQMHEEIESGIDEGCLTTEAWRKISDRWKL